MPDCSDIRKQWDEAFDADEAPAADVFQHLGSCDACRTYTASASGVREALRALPVGGVNDLADQALLRSLRSDALPVAPARRPVMPLVFAGAGSFALTMVVAGIMLSAASGTPEPPFPSAPSGIAAQPSSTPPDSNPDLDAWLAGPGLIAGSRAYRPAAVPAMPPKRRNLRGQNSPPHVA